jgi:processive 1,2-diacylglycerol beta-glucosyltransferase
VKLLFAYGFSPSGHASAAKALAARAQALGHEAACLDISSEYHEVLGPAINNVYLSLIRSFPNLWTTIHDSDDAASVLSNWRKIYHLFEGRRLRETVAELNPDRIVCTHAGPFAALTLAKEKGEVRTKLVGVLTDFKPHPYWAVPGADLYVTATEEGADSLVRRGIERSKVLAAGIPIHPVFDGVTSSRNGAKDASILISGGSRGLGRVEEAAEALAGLAGARLSVVCGANEELYSKLNARYGEGGSVKVHGAVAASEMAALMAKSDLLVGKAGGLTSAECLALGLPLVVLDPIAGQEQSNALFLQESGAAVAAGAPGELPGLVGSLLSGGTLGKMREAARALGRPDAGKTILDAVLR